MLTLYLHLGPSQSVSGFLNVGKTIWFPKCVVISSRCRLNALTLFSSNVKWYNVEISQDCLR